MKELNIDNDKLSFLERIRVNYKVIKIKQLILKEKNEKKIHKILTDTAFTPENLIDLANKSNNIKLLTMFAEHKNCNNKLREVLLSKSDDSNLVKSIVKNCDMELVTKFLDNTYKPRVAQLILAENYNNGAIVSYVIKKAIENFSYINGEYLVNVIEEDYFDEGMALSIINMTHDEDVLLNISKKPTIRKDKKWSLDVANAIINKTNSPNTVCFILKWENSDYTTVNTVLNKFQNESILKTIIFEKHYHTDPIASNQLLHTVAPLTSDINTLANILKLKSCDDTLANSISEFGVKIIKHKFSNYCNDILNNNITIKNSKYNQSIIKKGFMTMNEFTDKLEKEVETFEKLKNTAKENNFPFDDDNQHIIHLIDIKSKICEAVEDIANEIKVDLHKLLTDNTNHEEDGSYNPAEIDK